MVSLWKVDANLKHKIRMNRQTWLITGSTGLVGQAMTEKLLQGGHVVHALNRRLTPEISPNHKGFEWDPSHNRIDEDALKSVDVVLHLAGASVGQRWTQRQKRAILESRVQGTTLLMRSLQDANFQGTILQASAIGIYEESHEPLNESSALGSDFLAEVVKAWEAAASNHKPEHARLVFLRLGIVLAPDGGTLQKLIPVYRAGFGAPLASGNQWMSWIELGDALNAMRWCANNSSVTGPVNLTSPHPTPNRMFSQALAQALRRPHWAPRVPAWALRLMFGEMSSVMLQSQRILPQRLTEGGFQWQAPDLEAALAHCI